MLTMWRIGALALVVLFAGVAYSKEHPQAETAETKKAPEAEQRGSDKNPVAVKILPAPDAETKAAKKEQYRNEKATEDRWLTNATIWLAAITTPLAVFTGLLWWATYKLVRDARDTARRQANEMQASLLIAQESADTAKASVALAREEFISTHRPKLIIRKMSIKETTGVEPSDDRITIGYVVANIGDTDATIVEVSEYLWFPDSDGRHLPMIPPYSDSIFPGITIRAGNESISTYYGSKEQCAEYDHHAGFTTAHRAHDGTDPKHQLLFLGYIDYEDPLKRKRRTAFLRWYNFVTERFSPLDDPDYEYQD